MPFATGENVGQYRIVEKLGQGGMATVFKAYHPALDRYVAIKVLHPAFREDPSFLARFQREARIVARLDHPHIVPIYDFAEHRGHPYLVMRFVQGETLKARLKHGSPAREELQQVMDAVSSALAYAHHQGILHRDIKPSNIILTPDGHTYLTDFGLARMAQVGESTLSRDTMVGTPQYISPEQARGETQLDARTDVYSLGVVLYELLVGRAPFQADTPYAVIHDHIFTPLPLPRSLNPDLSEGLERVLLKALAKEPSDRYQTVDEMMAAFRAAVQVSPAAALPETIAAPAPTELRPAKKMRKRRRWPWALAAVGALLCLVITILGLMARAGQRNAGISPERPSAGDSSAEIPEEAQRLLEEARSARERGNSRRALDLYRQAAEAAPLLVPAYAEAGELLAKAGNADEAVRVLQWGLEANPESSVLHQRLAEVAATTEQWNVAEKEVRWLLQEMPEDPVSHAYAALLTLAQGGTCDEARAELDAALQIDPGLALTHYALALCQLQTGDADAARAELEFVLSQDDIPPGLRWRAEQYLTVLEVGVDEARRREFDALFGLAGQVPEGELQFTLMDTLERARLASEEGREEEALRATEDLQLWTQEHRAELDDALAGEIGSRLDRITRLLKIP
jgi:tetratricopeptide (TPR) repeat protein/predicted Ser/Thr protein kinase